MLGSLAQISFPVRVRARVLSLGRRPKTRSYANGGREISVDYHHLAALERLGLSSSPQRVSGWLTVRRDGSLVAAEPKISFTFTLTRCRLTISRLTFAFVHEALPTVGDAAAGTVPVT